MDDQLLTFAEEPNEETYAHGTYWKILIVDDDREVHSVTELVMHGVVILGKNLEFMHAYRASEAIEVLTKHPDIAVVLLDVVMESENAGLQLVKHVREQMQMQAIRIILRTGQPGYAPEYEAIRDYDINDYRTKSELSYARFLTSLTSALRSYTQISRVSKNAELLSYVIRSSPQILRHDTLSNFENGLVSIFQGILPPAHEYCLLHQKLPESDENISFQMPQIVLTSGDFTKANGSTLDFSATNIPPGFDITMLDLLRQAFESSTSVYGPSQSVHTFLGPETGNLYLLIKHNYQLDEDIRRILDITSVSAAMGFQNMNLLQQLRNLAYRDSITALLNRIGLINEIDRVRVLGLSDYALALIDIEEFSELNEALGHQYGDAILRAVSKRLTNHFPNDVCIARVGGDAFVLFGKESIIIPEIITQLFAKPFIISQHSMFLRMVCGFVRVDQVQGDGADILKDAYLAVKSAKNQKQNRIAYYNPRVEVENRNKILLLEDLQRTMKDDKLIVFYQPQVDLSNGNVTGFEALIRWKKNDGSYIPPSTFIPLAEQSGLIVDIGDWIIREVFKQKKHWNEQGLKNFRIAINISVRQFYNPGFVNFLASQLEEYDIDPADLEIEITESMAMNSIDEVIGLLTTLKKMNIKIALDDFGTGFSSLSYLQRLPIDRIKIDQAFVFTLHELERQKKITQTIIRMGQSLDLELIAEGVELEEQKDILIALGCQEAQGYFYGRPMDATACTEWLIKNKSQK